MPRDPSSPDSRLDPAACLPPALVGALADPAVGFLLYLTARATGTPSALVAVAFEGGAGIAAAHGPAVEAPHLLAAALATGGPWQLPAAEAEGWGDADLQPLAALPLALPGSSLPAVLAVAGRPAAPFDLAGQEALSAATAALSRQLELAVRLAGLEAERRELLRQLAAHRRLREGLRVLRPAIEQGVDAVLISSADLGGTGPVLLFANPAAERLLGYAPDELVGRPVRCLFGPRTDPEGLARLWRALAAGRPFRGTLLTCRKDGSEVWIERHVAPVRNDGRQVTHFVSIMHEAAAPAPAAGTGEPALAPLLGDSSDLCFRVAANGTILDYQAASESLLFTSPDRFLRRRLQEVLPPGGAAAAASGLAEAVGKERVAVRTYELPVGGRSQRFEARFLPLSGEEVLVLVRRLAEEAEAPPPS